MSYEIIREEIKPCKCGKGTIKIITKENDWFQIKEDVEINCEICKKTEREFIRITTSKKNKKDTAK